MDLSSGRAMSLLVLVALVAASCDEPTAKRADSSAGDLRPADSRMADGAAAPREGGAPDAAAADAHWPLSVDECQSPGADWVFCSGFEEGDKSIWDDYDGNPDETNLLLADPGPFDLAGNHVMRLRVPEGRGGADLVKVLPGRYDKLYARWYIKWEAGYDFSATNHGGGLFAGDRQYLGRSNYRPTGDDWFTAWLEPVPDSGRLNIYAYYRGMYMDCADPQGGCWGDHFPCMADEGQTYCTDPAHRPPPLPPVLEADRWYCIELMADAGAPVSDPAAASGAFDFWVDGQEIGPWQKLWLRTRSELQLSILWLNLFHHAEHSVEGVMYDNVVVSTSRVGCRP